MTPDEYLAHLRSVMEMNRDAMLRRFFVQGSPLKRSPTAQLSTEDFDKVKDLLVDVTPGNDPITDAVLRPRLKEVQDVARLLGLPTNEEIIIGTLPTFQPNACTFVVPGDGRRVIAFTEGLPGLLNRIAKISLQVHYAVSPQEHEQMNKLEDIRDFYRSAVSKALERHPELAVRFGAIVGAFAFEFPEILPPQPVQMPSSLKEWMTTTMGVLNQARSALLLGTERFVVAHEFGHFLQNSEGSALPSETVEVHGAPVDSVLRDYDAEYAADMYGEALAFSWSKDYYHSENLNEALESYLRGFDNAGPWFFFSAAEALDGAHQLVFGKRKAIDDTHPPYNLRSEGLHTVWDETHGYRNPQGQMLGIIISNLWGIAGASRQILENSLLSAWDDREQEISWNFTAE